MAFQDAALLVSSRIFEVLKRAVAITLNHIIFTTTANARLAITGVLGL
jgi:hypothetical protein